MFPIPAAAEPLVSSIRHVFTAPSFERFVHLVSGLIVTMGRRSVSRVLRRVQPLPEGRRRSGWGHWSDYHRLYSRVRFSMWGLGLALAQQVLRWVPPQRPVVLIADDTVDGKQGPRVWCKGPQRDAARSSRSRPDKPAVKFGHKWLVLCVLVWVPGASRPWALPVLCGLCCSESVAAKARPRYRHKTPSRLSTQLLIRMMRWFPQRRFIVLADARAASHALAFFAHRHQDRVTLISRMRADANLYDPPQNPKRRTRGGGLAKKGRKQPSPRQRIGLLPRHLQEVTWYGSSRRRICYVSDQDEGEARSASAGSGAAAVWFCPHDHCRVVPIRWVCVLGNKKQGRNDAYFYSTDTSMDPRQIIELYAMRWNIEVTFEESRALLGLETTRHRCRQSVLRVVPILLGCFSVVSLIWRELCERDPRLPARALRAGHTPCYHKQASSTGGGITFADALFAVRRELWQTTLLKCHGWDRCFTRVPRPLKEFILWHLTAAA